ncbi:MAG: copper chaperone PCu(A)C [Betaproteobacteria bacterium]|nr:copper chaperone PCu(A)C [Betaproteobacteria bacterium]
MLRSLLSATLLTSTAAFASAPVVKDAWVRTTVPGAKVSAAYMNIESPSATKLTKVETPRAGIVELHDMKMKDGVMEMKAEPSFAVPAKGALELKPGGKHVMLFKVAEQIKAGDKVPLSLTFEGADKKAVVVKVEAVAREGGAAKHH